MLSSKCLSPLVIHPAKVPGAVCSFGFFIHDGDVLREQHVANAHSPTIVMEFILRWQERGGQVIDLRPQDPHSELQSEVETANSVRKKLYFSGLQTRQASMR